MEPKPNCRNIFSSQQAVPYSTNLKKTVEDLENWLRDTYFTSVLATFNDECLKRNPPKFVQYRCEARVTCGGFGDRTRGVVAMFYVALFTNRVFHLHWNHPIDLGLYFNINAELYHVDKNQFNRQVAKASKNFVHRIFIDNESGLQTFLDRLYFSKDLISISTNRLFLKTPGVFDVGDFQQLVCDYFQNFPQVGNLTSSLLYAAGLRLLINSPTRHVDLEFNAFLYNVFPEERSSSARLRRWKQAYKIGVQIRIELEHWKEKPSNRVTFDQVNCFINEAVKYAKTNNENAFIFITSSDNNASLAVVNGLQQMGFHSIALTSVPVIHVDRFNWKSDTDQGSNNNITKQDIIKGNSKVVLDWYILTLMDQLIVSQSSFAKSASLVAMSPTRIFQHTDKDECNFYDEEY